MIHKAYNGDEAGTLSLPLGIKVKLYLDDLRDAKITDNGGSKQIEFTLDVSGTFLGANFPASLKSSKYNLTFIPNGSDKVPASSPL